MRALMWIGVLGLVLLVVAFGLEISKFGDRAPAMVIARNERADTVVLFFCHESSPRTECTGRRMPARSTASDLVRDIGRGEEAFTGEIVVTDEACTVLAREPHSVRGEFAVIVRVPDIDVRTEISPYGELHAPGYRVLEGTDRDVSCPLATG